MIVEDLDRRVWAALRPVDAVTGRALATPLRAHGEGQRWLANRAGLLVLHELRLPLAQREQFERYEASFAAPTAVAPPVTAEVLLEDPGGRWLARRFALALPRAATASGDALPPLFEPVEVPMYPAPNAALAAPWAKVRVSVTRGGAPAAGAALRIHEPGDPARVLGRGQCDARGEGVVAVSGVPAFIPSGGPTAFVRERAAELRVVFAPGGPQPPEPDALADRTDGGVRIATVSLVIASGRDSAAAVDLT